MTLGTIRLHLVEPTVPACVRRDLAGRARILLFQAFEGTTDQLALIVCELFPHVGPDISLFLVYDNGNLGSKRCLGISSLLTEVGNLPLVLLDDCSEVLLQGLDHHNPET